VTFIQAQTTIQPEEGIGGQGQEPHYNMTFIQSTIHAPSTIAMDVFANKFHKIKYFEDIEYDKIVALEAKVRAIKSVELYDPVQIAKMCLVLNVVVLKQFRVPEFMKYTITQYPSTHFKSYCNKMTEVVHDEKLLMHFFQDSFSEAALN
jgi:hypothetical protein